MIYLTLQRTRKSPLSTQGGVNFDGLDVPVFTLEPPELFEGRKNVPMRTCIPPGEYPIHLRESPHFSDSFQFHFGTRMVPHIDDVPGRDLILIHPLDFPHDTDGCIGPALRGWPPIADRQSESRPAMKKILAPLLDAKLRGESCRLRILDVQPQTAKPAA